VTPFHAHLGVDTIDAYPSLTLSTGDYSSGGLAGLNAGDRIELQCLARSDDTNARFTLLALHDGTELRGQRRLFVVGSEWAHYLYVLRIQNPMDPVTILLSSGERDGATGGLQTIEMTDFSLRVVREEVARVEFGDPVGTPHRGAVTFDVLSLDYQPENATQTPFPDTVFHTADTNKDLAIDTEELLRVIQLYNARAMHCDSLATDGYAPGEVGDTTCNRHDSDYLDPAWTIELRELLRLVQLYHAPSGYTACPDGGTVDGFCL
jgi:hypothetical protein